MKLMQVLKNRKGFTLMELIVVLIIIAILMAALLPTLIGWINESRENSLRVEGRTALLAIQTTTTHAAGTGRWNDAATGTIYNGVTTTLIQADYTFRSLIRDAALYGNNNTVADPSVALDPVAFGAASATTDTTRNPRIVRVFLDGSGNVVGLSVANTVRLGRNVDGIGNGELLVGNSGTAAPAS